MDDRQHHGRVMTGDPAAHQQAAVRPVTALREEDLQHHDVCSSEDAQQERRRVYGPHKGTKTDLKPVFCGSEILWLIGD